MNTTPPCKSEQYFNSQICEFRQMMGQKTFWADPKKVALAKQGISCLYISGVKDNFANPERVANTFLSTMEEFTRRALLIGFDI